MKRQVLIGSIIIICGLFIILTTIGGFQLFSSNVKGEEAMQSYSASQFDNVKIESTSTNIKLISSEDNETIRINLYKSSGNKLKPLDIADYVTSNHSKDTLELEVKSKKKWFNLFNFGSNTLHVEIPPKLLKKLTVESNSGNIEAGDLEVEVSATLEARSGNIKLNNASTHELTVSASSGNLSLHEINITTGEFEVNSGNIKIESIYAKELSVETKSGNIDLNGDVAQLTAEANSGNIDLELKQLLDHSKLKTSSGNIKLALETPGSLYVTHDKNSGSTSINKSGFEKLKDLKGKLEGVFGSGDIKLDVKTNSGNFRLN